MVLAIVDDLLFRSKIRAAAISAGGSVAFVMKRDLAISAIREQHPGVVVLDLDRDALDPIGLIHELRSTAEFAGVRLVGFASHVHTARIQQARAAGCDQVLARSGFVAALPHLFDLPAGPAAS